MSRLKTTISCINDFCDWLLNWRIKDDNQAGKGIRENERIIMMVMMMMDDG